MTHAESEVGGIGRLWSMLAGGLLVALHKPWSRSAIAELDAARSVLRLARESGAAVYLVHVTLPEVAAEIRSARMDGVRAFGETCPHYLMLDDSVYSRPHGERFVCSPPIRSAAAARGLWRNPGVGLTPAHPDPCCVDS